MAGELSEDGKWIWNGSEWKPFAPPELPEQSSQSDTNSSNPNLVLCRDCGNEISKRAVSCPNCGAPRKTLVRVNSNKFEEPMHRDIEQGLFIVGLLFWVAVVFILFLGQNFRLTDQLFSGIFSSTAICSITLASVFLVDIFYLKIKSDWQKENGKSNSSSLVQIFLYAIFILICFGSLFVIL